MRCSRGVMVAVPLTSALAILSCITLILSRGDCPEGNFICKSSRTCILQRSFCDGHVDCLEGEDEDPLYCNDLHGSFWEITDRVKFRTPNETCNLEEAPEICRCVEFTVICYNLSLEEVPMPISHDVKALTLDRNKIKTLPKGTFDNFSLNFIHLGYNELTVIPDDIFASQKYLRKLYIVGNALSSVPTSAVTLPKLEWLYLDENNLTELKLEEWNLPSLSWLDLSKNNITLDDETFNAFPELEVLVLDHNDITRIEATTFSNLTMLIDLSIGWNKISYISDDAFTNLTRLQDLNLKNNLLLTLDSRLLMNQVLLEKLIIAGNSDFHLTKDLLEPLYNLKSLDLEGIDVPDISQEFFAKLTNLDTIYFKRFKYCMSVPHVPKCFPLSDGTSTSEDLLGNLLLRATLWLVSSFTLVANGMVIWRRLASSPNSISPLNIIITNLACADLLMGVYLLALGFEDLWTRGTFRQISAQWQSSVLCTFLGVIAMISSEASVLILLLISAERFMLISAPLSGFQSLKPKAALMTSATVWVFSIIIATLPVAEWRHSMRFYGTNSFCFPLHIDEPFMVGWQYSAFVFIGINSVSLIVIATLYAGVFLSILKTRNATTLNVNDSEFALRFFFIVLTNACCWVPIIILKIIAFMDMNISKDVYGWLGVFVLPVNSAVNPILYTFTTPRYRTSQTTTSRSKSHHDGPAQMGRDKPPIWNRALGLVQLKPSPRAVVTPRTTEEQI